MGDLLRVKHGFAFKGAFFEEKGPYVVLTPGNFFERGGFRKRDGKDRSYSGEIPTGYILSEGDVVIAMTEQSPGLLGSSALIPEDGRYLHNQRIGLLSVVDEDTADRKFLYYLFNTRPVRSQIASSATGVKVRHTAPERIYRVKTRVPDIGEQRKIAGVLSAYDDCIENSRRRIELLEEASRLLYREWFVHLHFPGHEHVQVIDGVPEGWSTATIGEYCPLIYGKALTADSRVPGDFNVYGSSGIVGVHNTKLVDAPAIVVGRKGNIGSVFWARRGFWPIDTVYYVSPENSNLFTYYALRHVPFISTDVAVPGLNRDFAHSRELLIPTDRILEGFHALVEPIQAQIGCLERQSNELAKARDLLLPRLMDGRLEV